MNKIVDIAKYVRLRDNGIRISRNYIKAWNEDPSKIMRTIENLFDIKPHYTSKNEIIYDSGVLYQLFSNIIERDV